jgi:hypothetical protein
MYLSEIFNAEISDQRWTDIVNAMIEKHGLESFHGLQATVVATPDRDHVYRIWTRDPGYERWLDIARGMQDNPHVMKILSRVRTIPTKFKGMPKDLKVKFVKLEKLKPIVKNKARADQAFHYWTFSEDKENIDQSFMMNNKSFFDTLNKINDKVRLNDVTADNVMMRGDTLVLVDPLR